MGATTQNQTFCWRANTKELNPRTKLISKADYTEYICDSDQYMQPSSFSCMQGRKEILAYAEGFLIARAAPH